MYCHKHIALEPDEVDEGLASIIHNARDWDALTMQAENERRHNDAEECAFIRDTFLKAYEIMTGREVCFKGENEWWNEYVDIDGNFYYER